MSSILLTSLFLSALGSLMMIDFIHKHLDPVRFYISVFLLSLTRFISLQCCSALYNEVVGVLKKESYQRHKVTLCTLGYALGALWA